MCSVRWSWVLALMIGLPALATACPPHAEAKPDEAGVAADGDAASADPNAIRHLSHWRDTTGERWTVAADVEDCDELDLDELARMGGVAEVDCRARTPTRLTLVVPRQIVDSNRNWLRNGAPLEEVVPGHMPVDVIVYDVAREGLVHAAAHVRPHDVYETVEAALEEGEPALKPVSMDPSQTVVEWVTRAVVNERQPARHWGVEAIVILAPTPDGPPGVATVERALALLPTAQYTVVSTSNDGGTATTPMLTGISHAGFATGPLDAETLRTVIFDRYLIESDGRPAESDADRAASVAMDQLVAISQNRSPSTCGSRAGIYTSFMAVLLLWYIVGLNVAFVLLLLHKHKVTRGRSDASSFDPDPGPGRDR